MAFRIEKPLLSFIFAIHFSYLIFRNPLCKYVLCLVHVVCHYGDSVYTFSCGYFTMKKGDLSSEISLLLQREGFKKKGRFIDHWLGGCIGAIGPYFWGVPNTLGPSNKFNICQNDLKKVSNSSL